MQDTTVRYGFYAAAAFNILGMLTFSKGLTNQALFDADPELFSRSGCALVMVWGLAYLAQAASWRTAPWVSAVFAVEKLFFAGSWARWMAREGHRLPRIAEGDPLAGAFFGAYGVGDGLFALFFAWAFLRARRGR